MVRTCKRQEIEMVGKHGCSVYLGNPSPAGIEFCVHLCGSYIWLLLSEPWGIC